MERRILVPTDFSECANNALNYALKLAMDLKAELILMHSIVHKGYTSLNKHKERHIQLIDMASSKLEEVKRFASLKEPGIAIQTILKEGPPDSTITEILENERIDYIVMGTEGATGRRGAIFGSFANSVITFSNRPVFAIPSDAKYRSLKDILIISQLHVLTELYSVATIAEMAKIFDAKVHLLNVDKDADLQKQKYESFRNELKSSIPYPKIELHIKHSFDIISSIDKFICTLKADLIVTLGNERDFFDKLFKKSDAGDLCLYPSTPILSYPKSLIPVPY